jgi:hypothetical protein
MAIVKRLFGHWDEVKILGWNFDTVESVKEAYVKTFGSTLESYLDDYYNDTFKSSIEPLFRDSSIKLNLGGDNEKTKIEFSDRPIGVFDFSLASQQLFRVQEFYSDTLAKQKPDLFLEYELPAGVVPNYFVDKELQGENTVFFYYDAKENNKYYVEKRQKGLTQALLDDPTLGVKILGGMLIPEKPVKGVKFSSNTKKPYVKYKRRGGKVRYVEIYSINYYTSMTDSNFFMAIRHLPALMVAEYLEKMGTMCKFYITRFVRQGELKIPKELDNTTNAQLPLWKEWQDMGGKRIANLVIQPMCVKEYGTEMDKNFLFNVGSNNDKVYRGTYFEMEKEEITNPNKDAYGNPDFDYEYIYQEGFERYRQKFLAYTKVGLWKAKEVTEQGLIYYHDLVMNSIFVSETYKMIGQIERDYPNFDTEADNALSDPNKPIDRETFAVMYTASTSKWFELWMKISANTIKHKLDIFNSGNSRKTYEEVGREIDLIREELDLIVRGETQPNLKRYFESWKTLIETKYKLNNKKLYCADKINEMTFFAQGGMFTTPEESIEKRSEEADRLLEELDKVSF